MQLHGLTPKQVKLCNDIWGMDTEEELMEWFYSLPDSLKFEAHAMINLMLFEEIDHVVAGQAPADMIQAQKILSRF
jgi:hypothetical protein